MIIYEYNIQKESNTSTWVYAWDSSIDIVL